MLGSINKTDKLDVQAQSTPAGRARCRRCGFRRACCGTNASCRVYGWSWRLTHPPEEPSALGAGQVRLAGLFSDVSDLFGADRARLESTIQQLPPQAAYTSQLLLEQLDQLQEAIRGPGAADGRGLPADGGDRPARYAAGRGPDPGGGAAVGDRRHPTVPCAEQLASYAGTVPRVHLQRGQDPPAGGPDRM